MEKNGPEYTEKIYMEAIKKWREWLIRHKFVLEYVEIDVLLSINEFFWLPNSHQKP